MASAPLNTIPTLAPKDMSGKIYEKFSSFIYTECGIKLPPIKKIMLQSRLSKRLRALGMASFEEYYEYITNSKDREKELVHALDAVSTNKTDFFREPSHFDYLRKTALPKIIHSLQRNYRKQLNIWSAGCSSGEEPYTLAMVLSDFMQPYSELTYEILGTDISMRVLAHAQRAIYKEEDIQPIPPHFRIQYLMRGKEAQKGNWRVVPELRNRIEFRRLNLMDDYFDLPSSMNIIFCRNVIIYFDRPTQSSLFKKFYKYLVPGGFLFIGHSETLHGINDQFEYLQATIYRKPL